MDIRTKLTADDLAGIVKLASDSTYAGNVITNRCEEIRTTRDGAHLLRLTLRVNRSDNKGAHLAPSGRRTVSACWHAYRDVLRTLFDHDPDAIVSSGLARYVGRSGFVATFPRTYFRNVGSQARPIAYGKLCACGSDPERAIEEIRNRPYADGYAHLARFA